MGGKGFTASGDKFNIACMGIGGKGRVDVQEVSHENIIALCDVDQVRAREKRGNMKNAYDTFPNTRKYEDFREMLDTETDIDAVTISTPDHTNTVITMEAMKKGKHVYTQKPLTRTVDESRKIVGYANGQNFFTITDYEGFDPETNQRETSIAYPIYKTYSLGVQVTF